MSESIKVEEVQETVQRLLEQLNPGGRERVGTVIIDTVHQHVPGLANRVRSVELGRENVEVTEDIKELVERKRTQLGADVFSDDTDLVVGSVSFDFGKITEVDIRKLADGRYAFEFQYVSNEETRVLGRTTKTIKNVTAAAQNSDEAAQIIKELRARHIVNIADFTREFPAKHSASVKNIHSPS
jgi:hypothetical protein